MIKEASTIRYYQETLERVQAHGYSTVREFLMEEYHRKGTFCSEVAKILGKTTTGTLKIVKRLGIPVRPPGGARKRKVLVPTFHGKPCLTCGETLRYVAGRHCCVTCSRRRSLEYYLRHKERRETCQRLKTFR